MKTLNLYRMPCFTKVTKKFKYRFTAVFLLSLASWMVLMPVAQVYAETASKPQEEKKLLSADEVRKKKEAGRKHVVKNERFSVANGVKEPALGSRGLPR